MKIESHNVGCNAVSWAPALQNKRFVTGGCDNLVKIWKFDEETQKWINEHTLEGHTDWVSSSSGFLRFRLISRWFLIFFCVFNQRRYKPRARLQSTGQ